MSEHRIGWIGAGRMGYRLVERLLANGCDVWVYNRTRAKAEPLGEQGATVVDSPTELSHCDIVFTMVAGSQDVLDVTIGPDGVLSGEGGRPAAIVDSSTISPEASAELRQRAAELDVGVIAAPVSGNPSVVASGNLTVVASGPKDQFEMARPYLEMFGKGVTYVGEGDESRLVKICHNLLLGVMTQSLAEITILAQKAGVSRYDFLEFINSSVVGSTFSRYKSPQFVNLDWEPTFTWHLLRKDFELGLEQGRALDVPLPVAGLVHQIVTDGIGRGWGDLDFGALLELEAGGAAMELESENRVVDDGLGPS